ncbi:hypothetical protein Tco_1051014, partial [Tanacetum coccineum]
MIASIFIIHLIPTSPIIEQWPSYVDEFNNSFEELRARPKNQMSSCNMKSPLQKICTLINRSVTKFSIITVDREMVSCFLCTLTSSHCSGDDCPFQDVFGPNVSPNLPEPNVPSNVMWLERLVNSLTPHRLKALLLRSRGNPAQMLLVRDSLINEHRWRATNRVDGISGELNHVIGLLLQVTQQLQNVDLALAQTIANLNEINAIIEEVNLQNAELLAQLAEANEDVVMDVGDGGNGEGGGEVVNADEDAQGGEIIDMVGEDDDDHDDEDQDDEDKDDDDQDDEDDDDDD